MPVLLQGLRVSVGLLPSLPVPQPFPQHISCFPCIGRALAPVFPGGPWGRGCTGWGLGVHILESASPAVPVSQERVLCPYSWCLPSPLRDSSLDDQGYEPPHPAEGPDPISSSLLTVLAQLKAPDTSHCTDSSISFPMERKGEPFPLGCFGVLHPAGLLPGTCTR